MFLKLLTNSNEDNKVIYSIAIIIEKQSKSIYSIKFGNIYGLIYTNEILKSGEWIRFYGKYKENVINIEYVEILYDLDINLLKNIILKLDY